MRTIRRLIHVVAVLSGHGLRWLAWRLRRRRTGPDGPQRLRAILEDLGGVFVKLGQVLALQPDVLPLEYCDALFDLLDRMPPVPLAEVERVFSEEIGRRPAEVFARFDRKPIASASIAQVHVGVLDGRRWAVKVQRPTTARDFAPDLRLLGAARRAVRLGPRRWRWIADSLDEFIHWTEAELDFRTEARVMRRLGRSSAGEPRRRVPRVRDELTTARVLTAEFLDGPTVLELVRARAGGVTETAPPGYDEREFATALVENFLGDVFREGVFHSDLHPANLLVLPGNTVGYVDFGISGVLSTYARRELLALALAYTRGDLEGVYEAYLALARPSPDADDAAFRAGLEDLAEEWFDRQPGGLRLRKSYTVVFLEITRLSRRTRLWPAAEVLSYFRSVITLDGLSKRFAPGFDVSQALEDFSTRHLRERSLARAFSPGRAAQSAAAALRLLSVGAPRLHRLLERDQHDDRAAAASRRTGERGVRAALLFCGFAVLFLLIPAEAGAAADTASGVALLAGVSLAGLIATVARGS